MKFTLSTKPLADALDLGVIPANISKYYRLSCLAQLTADRRELRINLQANNICTEILLKGSGDSDEQITAFVDCLVLKQLVGTFDTSTTILEYTDGGIILHSGSSKFTLPYLAESEDGELQRPRLADATAPKVKIDLSDWKFIKDYQMYAVALSFVHPIYMNVWIGESGDVIVGDYDNSLFTFSKKNKLGKTCLLTDTIVNLFNSLPEGSDVTLMEDSYRIDVKTDSFEYASEFSPKYENQDGVGEYSAEVILSTVQKDSVNSIKVPVAPISKFLSQADLLSSGSDTKIQFGVSGSEIQIKDENVDCKLKFEGHCSDFQIPLDASRFRLIIGHVDTDNITLCPIMGEDDSVSGLIIWTDSLSVVIGAVDEEG